MGVRFANVNGIRMAYRVRGKGPALVLVMGYRLNSAAWPATFIEQLARQFTVITLDNRGTGLSDKPVHGYAIANLARDVCGLLDELEIAKVNMFGYSMGGAIAQEFVRQFPNRVSHLVLCATMPPSWYRQCLFIGTDRKRLARDQNGASDPNVWSGRGVQEVFVDLANAVLHQCIRSLTGAHRGSRLIMDISAHAI
jgi:pimeloyl-ACP methyl ester carboxylesterase